MEPKTVYETRVVIHSKDDKDALDDLVLGILQTHVGKDQRIERIDLVNEVYGPWHGREIGMNSVEDRRVREAIERLREKWVILSSSGSGGYRMPESEAEAQDFIAEMESRAMKMLKTVAQVKRNLSAQFKPGAQIGLWG